MISPYENTLEAGGAHIYLTAFLGAGPIIIDDIALDVSPVSFTSPIKCKKVSTLGIDFLFYTEGPGITSRFIDYPAFLPGTLPMLLQ